jgi:hypothetical protein
VPAINRHKRRCESKKVYETKEEAERSIPLRKDGTNTKHGPSLAYECRWCHKWHTGRPHYVKVMVQKYGSWDEARAKMKPKEVQRIIDVLGEVPK